MKARPDANIKIAALSGDATRIAIPMRKGEETAALQEAIDLSEFSWDGVPSELSVKYFGSGISQNP